MKLAWEELQGKVLMKRRFAIKGGLTMYWDPRNCHDQWANHLTMSEWRFYTTIPDHPNLLQLNLNNNTWWVAKAHTRCLTKMHQNQSFSNSERQLKFVGHSLLCKFDLNFEISWKLLSHALNANPHFSTFTEGFLLYTELWMSFLFSEWLFSNLRMRT